jgi:hypothetical protein
MNEQTKELAVQAGATLHKAMHGEAISFLENDLERFAELVRQDEREKCAKAMQPMLRDMISRGQAAEIIRGRSE